MLSMVIMSVVLILTSVCIEEIVGLYCV